MEQGPAHFGHFLPQFRLLYFLDCKKRVSRRGLVWAEFNMAEMIWKVFDPLSQELLVDE
jgi:hypothetical protein